MENDTVSPDPRLLVEVPDVTVTDARSHREMHSDAFFYAFLCPTCNDTHLVFQCQGIPLQFNVRLKVAEAEKLGSLIANPQVAQED